MADDRLKIILVDDSRTNLKIGKSLLKDQYEVFPVPSARVLFELLENVYPDLILLDIEMPEMTGYEAIRILKEEDRWRDIPVMFLTSKTDPGAELEGLTLGAIDYITKPFSPALLLKRIENHLLMVAQQKKLHDYNDNLQWMVAEQTRKIVRLQNAVISTLAEMVEARDGATGAHIERTQRYLLLLVHKMLSENVYLDEILSWELEFVIPSAQLHDIGKIAISDLILNKPSKLTEEEYEIMKTHTTVGAEAVERIESLTEEHDFLTHARLFAESHHEKWDGTGYPYGLVAEDIPLQGRLMAIADVYDALVSTRPYKKPFPPEEAARIIINGSGTHFDPALVEIFEKVQDEFAVVARRLI
ncbi:response regulator [Phaeovibrio sulfidiphilus]|uniref:Response regulator n=1 Tax=Phaeovibrio sulfidiphilus TaxID=1220600 RepID=A0A8J6YN83_9PROT|nr:HD domain-containing phosphohydrolase [Phaeovibrio sulfidiphilus]MBE1236969.1 response regulator [Phaeovibrio sulfidiphilus]